MYEHPPDDKGMAQQLERLRSVHVALAHGISHDLRAPLRVIDGFSRQLESDGQLGGAALDQLHRIRGAGQRMGTLIEQLLEYLRADSVELHPGPVDLSLLADWAGAELCDAQPQRAARIDVGEGLEAWGDERQYKVLFDQLLANAWRFSSERDEVHITVRGRRVDDLMHLEVSDEGSGFDPKFAERVFEPFQRMHSADQGAGNGLGLAIARAIVERAGGHIRAEGRPGEGCRVLVELPAQAPEPPQETPQETPQPQGVAAD